jgi:hypothetical protein
MNPLRDLGDYGKQGIDMPPERETVQPDPP